MIDLRERFRQPKPKAGKPLTPAAQCVLLYHLQRQPLANLPLREIAERIGYSPVMLTKVKAELLAAELCEPKRIGRSVALHCTTEGRQLWDAARPLLSSPVAKTVWIQGEKPGHPALQAGLTALSRRTMIADGRTPQPRMGMADSGFVAFSDKDLHYLSAQRQRSGKRHARAPEHQRHSRHHPDGKPVTAQGYLRDFAPLHVHHNKAEAPLGKTPEWHALLLHRTALNK